MISLNILFANDDVLTQWVMSEVLAEAGFNVVGACRVEQVIDLLDDAPDFDVLLADLGLSNTTGPLDMSLCWHTALPGRPVIHTGPDRSALHRPLRLGESFLVTPFSAAALLRTIDRALEDACFHPLVPAVSYAGYQFH